MFETAVVHARGADRKLLIISVIGHSAIVAAVVAASIASTHLPEEAPKQILVPFLQPAPLPVMSNPAPQPRPAAPPNGNGGPAPAQTRVTVPSVIPDAIPIVAPAATTPSPTPSSADGAGDPNGTKDSVGTDPNAPAGPPAATGPFVPGIAGVTSPVVITRVEPVYPPVALRGRLNGSVVLQCIIDKSGHIRDVQVLHSSFAAFEQPAIDAVRQWVFSPGTLNGQPVDVIFELTVKFQVR